MSEILSKEIATKEINDWLDSLDITSEMRELQKVQIDRLVYGVSNGSLVINEDKSITQKLKFPFGNEVKVKELVYKNNLTVAEIEMANEDEVGVPKSNTHYPVYYSYIKALTGQNKMLTRQMNNKDYKISESIALFFMD